MSASLDALIPELQAPAKALVDLAGRAGVQPRVTSTLRTRYQQERLYRRWQQGLNPYPVARPGTSAHEFGYAFDLVVDNTTDQEDLGTVWTSWGGIWGGSRDPVHFEYPGFSPGIATSSSPAQSASIGATVADFLLGFVPGLGEVELVATIVGLLPGADQSTVLRFLEAPVATVEREYPGVLHFVLTMPPFGLFQGAFH